MGAGPHVFRRAVGHPGDMSLRCLIVDDSDLFRDAARDLLERDGVTVVGLASTGAEALERAEELKPEVVLLDICLGSDSGFDVARWLEDRARATSGQDWRPAIILVSTHAEDELVELIDQSPAIGFVPKPALSGKRIMELLAGRPG
jgi:DNA-binding NarL/FixJ family response regulator